LESEAADLSALKTAELRDMCKSKGLPTSGRKADLVARLSEPVSDDFGLTGFSDDNVLQIDDTEQIDVSSDLENDRTHPRSDAKRAKASTLPDSNSALLASRPGPSAPPTVRGHIQFCGCVS